MIAVQGILGDVQKILSDWKNRPAVDFEVKEDRFNTGRKLQDVLDNLLCDPNNSQEDKNRIIDVHSELKEYRRNLYKELATIKEEQYAKARKANEQILKDFGLEK